VISLSYEDFRGLQEKIIGGTRVSFQRPYTPNSLFASMLQLRPPAWETHDVLLS